MILLKKSFLERVLHKALFLDRDGVINVEKNYLYKIEDFEFIDGIFELTKFFQEKGYKIIVVTNQSGIARGYYSKEDFTKLSSWMKEQFLKKGIEITDIYHCPHHPDFTGECFCRKPKPGMFLDAKRDHDIDLENSIMIGDKQSDIEAAKAAGIKRAFLFDGKNIKSLSEVIDAYS